MAFTRKEAHKAKDTLVQTIKNKALQPSRPTNESASISNAVHASHTQKGVVMAKDTPSSLDKQQIDVDMADMDMNVDGNGKQDPKSRQAVDLHAADDPCDKTDDGTPHSKPPSTKPTTSSLAALKSLVFQLPTPWIIFISSSVFWALFRGRADRVGQWIRFMEQRLILSYKMATSIH